MWLLPRGPKTPGRGWSWGPLTTQLMYFGLSPFINEKCGLKRRTDVLPSEWVLEVWWKPKSPVFLAQIPKIRGPDVSQIIWKVKILLNSVLVCLSCHNKVPQPGRLKQQKFLFSQSWGLKVQDQGVSQVGLFWGLSPCLADGCLLAVSSHALLSVHLCVLILSSEDTSQDRWGPTLRTSFELNYLFKDPISKYRHILKSWGLGFQHTNLDGAQFSP